MSSRTKHLHTCPVARLEAGRRAAPEMALLLWEVRGWEAGDRSQETTSNCQRGDGRDRQRKPHKPRDTADAGAALIAQRPC